MKQKMAITGAVALAFAAAATGAHAQSAGSFYVTTGWFHLAPQDSSDPLKIMNVGGSPVNHEVPNTGAGIDNADTIGLAAGYFLTDHIATELVAGIPPRFNLNGKGSLEQFGVLGHAYQWSPALLLKYYFNDAKAKFRPYVGIGASYIWFTGAKITNTAYHWFGGLSVSYIPVSLTATLTTQRPTPIGNVTQTSQAKITLNPIVTYLNIGYRF